MRNDLLAAYYGQMRAGVLPLGYRSVAYLRSTGTQWLDTEVGIKEGLVITGRYKYSGTALSIIDGRYYIQLSPSVYGNNIFLLAGGSGKNAQGFYGRSGSGVNMIVSGTNARWNEFNLRRGALTVNGTTTTRTEPAFVSGYSTPLYLFAGHYVNNPNPGDNVMNLHPGEGYTLDIARIDIADNGVPTRSFVPCVRRRDSKPGMYDLCGSICPLTGTPFYVNQGEGDDFAWGELS